MPHFLPSPGYSRIVDVQVCKEVYDWPRVKVEALANGPDEP
jgi:hypothetical protein